MAASGMHNATEDHADINDKEGKKVGCVEIIVERCTDENECDKTS